MAGGSRWLVVTPKVVQPVDLGLPESDPMHSLNIDLPHTIMLHNSVVTSGPIIVDHSI